MTPFTPLDPTIYSNWPVGTRIKCRWDDGTRGLGWVHHAEAVDEYQIIRFDDHPDIDFIVDDFNRERISLAELDLALFDLEPLE